MPLQCSARAGNPRAARGAPDEAAQDSPPQNVIADETARRAYECDAFTMYRAAAAGCRAAETVPQVQAIMALAQEMNVKIVPRGGGTSLSGGSMPLEDGISPGMSKFNRILEIDLRTAAPGFNPACRIWRSPGRRTWGLYYAPDHLLRSPARSAAMSRRTLAECIA